MHHGAVGRDAQCAVYCNAYTGAFVNQRQWGEVPVIKCMHIFMTYPGLLWN